MNKSAQKIFAKFKKQIPDIALKVFKFVDDEKRHNKEFAKAIADFTDFCRQEINRDISKSAVEEMLIQHLLTEQLFRRIFDTSDFANRNVLAVEIEKVVQTLDWESDAATCILVETNKLCKIIDDKPVIMENFDQRQQYVNAVCENFLQGYSALDADVNGVVYTPQQVVDFMINSVEDILKKEFGKSLNDKGVHIIDPFVGTGNFIIHLMQKIKNTSLQYKYENDFHCNELILFPYYTAGLNIEQEYLELTGQRKLFNGICLVDTFDLAECDQMQLFPKDDTQCVLKQKEAPMFVIIGNPPYNAKQSNENDNNKNRKHPVIDKRVRETYAKDSKTTYASALDDPYVKAIRWAADRIGDEGIVALITNNSFIDSISFDGVRKHLEKDFNILYCLDLGGNQRMAINNSKVSSVFGVRVGTSINIFVKNKSKKHCIYYSEVGEQGDKLTKLNYLKEKQSCESVDWKEIIPDKNYTWLTDDLRSDFDDLIPIGTKEARRSKQEAENVLFKLYGSGVKTSGDAYVYNFNREELIENAKKMVENYNSELNRWIAEVRLGRHAKIEDFLNVNENKLKWTRHTRESLKRGVKVKFDINKIRESTYRPFVKKYYYFEKLFNERLYRFPKILPNKSNENENQVICVSGVGAQAPFHSLITNKIPESHFAVSAQCFPFYVYNEDGTNRRENITDWALDQWQSHYNADTITKWDIFYYVYGLLHHPGYKDYYRANLWRALPRIPFTPDFYAFAKDGARLADIHINYELQKEYPLEKIEHPDKPQDWRVARMKFNNDKSAIIYNDFLTLADIPPQAHEYRLGNRSALDWIIDQYRVKTDNRSGIVNDPNDDDDPEYIVRLIGKVITVSLETVGIVKSLPSLKQMQTLEEATEFEPLFLP